MTFGTVAAGLALIAFARGGGEVHATPATVTVADFSFTDSSSGTTATTIQAGESVTWTWASGTHSATSDSLPVGASAFDSDIHSTPFSFGPTTFTVAGTYTYRCTVHPTMTGTINVQAASTATPVTPTSTPVAPTSTSVAATSTPAPEATTLAATSTVPAATATSPALIAPAATASSGGAAAGAAALPRSGDGASDGGSSGGMWLTVALVGAAAMATASVAGVRLRRRARR